MGYGDVETYPNPTERLGPGQRIHTPHLAQLCHEGMKFTQVSSHDIADIWAEMLLGLRSGLRFWA